MKNPYKYKGPLDPVKDELVCIPRDKEVQKIVNGIQKGEYWALIGSMQVGKTTFLRLIEKAFPHAYYVYINFDTSELDKNKFYRSIINEFQKSIPCRDKQDMDKIWEEYGPELTFLNFLENLKPEDDKRKVILFFDEIEKVSFIADFLHLWRKVFHERYYKTQLSRYSVIVSGSTGLIPITKGANSPFNIAEICYLKDFSGEEMLKLIENPLKMLDVFIEPAAKEKLCSRVSGHPQLLQHLCYLLVKKALAGEKIIKENHIDWAIQTLFKDNLVLDALRQHIKINSVLEELLRDILNLSKKMYYPNKDYSIAGAGAIVEQGRYCAIRNEIFDQFVKGIFSDRKNRSISPIGKKLLKLEDKIQTEVNKLKEYEEQLAYENDIFLRQKCEKDLLRLKNTAEIYKRKYGEMAKEVERAGNELSIKVENLMEELFRIIDKVSQLLRQKKVLDHYHISNTSHIVSNLVKRLDIEVLKDLENIILLINSNEIEEIKIHKVLSDVNFIVSHVKHGTILCTYHALGKQIEQLAKETSEIKDIKLKFILYLPVIPSILIHKEEFRCENNTEIDLDTEFRALEKKWSMLHGIVDGKKR